ncbi:hypothetical protein D3C85_631990 [compost metagenome]
MQYLIDNGYKNYQTETDSLGTVEKWQKRVDTKPEFSRYPLCHCNDKLFLNIEGYDYTIGEVKYHSYSIFLVHENKHGEWCDLKIYSISEEELVDNLKRYELQLLDMWLVFYGESK